ncbi:mite allergen Der p 3-like [Sitodiplosis mosellana]|uniref:mite allergen Der p 3-like n=1 Tax=Sitodiplosis mosellana TaxID=263140 RepID=UPI0024450D14|nr:mite allergen Der p 3-like [Sitodiplosis mosellana]
MTLSKLILLWICTVSMAKCSVARFIHAKANVAAPSHKFLFAASITSASEHICSGIILNKRWVISSALCVSQNTVSTLHVRYGSHNRTYNEIVNEDIEKIIVHPHFKQKMLANNLALIKVSNDIRFIPTVVQAATLPTKKPAENDMVDAVGWEKIDETNQSDTPEILKYHQTKVTGLDTCSINLSHLYDVDIDTQFLCTNTTIEDTFPELDNGSALISAEKNELIGIASWYDEEFPNVYVRIRTYLPWIRSVVIE